MWLSVTLISPMSMLLSPQKHVYSLENCSFRHKLSVPLLHPVDIIRKPSPALWLQSWEVFIVLYFNSLSFSLSLFFSRRCRFWSMLCGSCSPVGDAVSSSKEVNQSLWRHRERWDDILCWLELLSGVCCCSVATSPLHFSSSWPHGLQHIRLSCPSLCPQNSHNETWGTTIHSKGLILWTSTLRSFW